MNYLSKLLILLISINLTLMPVLALEFDVSVDDEIRKNYNPSKLEMEGLPPLPNIKPVVPIQKPVSPSVPSQNTRPANQLPALTQPTVRPIISKVDKSTAIRIKKGTKFKVSSSQGITDGTAVGTRLSFVSLRPVTQRYVTVPQKTVFKGQVEDSHFPQLAGNGGLIVLSIDSMIYKGSTVKVNAKITKANKKKIFLNNIKGKHQYLKGTANSLKPGTKFYKKMMKTTSKLANGSVTVLFSPFTVIAGVLVYVVNFIGSPLFGLFSKGGRISIPQGCEFEIKILEDVYLY